MIDELQPEWLALRQFEARLVYQDNPKLLSEGYQLVHRFDVSRELAAVPGLPGRIHLEYDQTYEVFHRVSK
ncbi:MAG: hypothetical protein EXS42_07930 [Lacunisphaera sp.]|nr:hypothetical protein [Lacunisphaera sp.]